MAGKIVADTLEHSTAGSIATNYVVEGSAKAWVSYDQITATDIGSLNISTIADNSEGNFTINFTSNLENDDYCSTVHTASSSTTIDTSERQAGNSVKGTSSHQQVTGYIGAAGGSLTVYDNGVNDLTFYGDLA